MQSIGALAVAPSDPNIVWAGTGEACIRSHISVGEGHLQVDRRRQDVDADGPREDRAASAASSSTPPNPDIVLACALGHAYGPQPERGIFRTTDGGKNWERVRLFVDENTGCSEIAMDPSNPRILFAGMWQLEIHTWGRESGGPGSGLFISRDGGVTWTKLTGRGLPTKTVGKVMPAIAPLESRPRLRADRDRRRRARGTGKETDRGQLWRSDDGGDNWRVVSTDRNAMGRTALLRAHGRRPRQRERDLLPHRVLQQSIDGGATLVASTGARKRRAAITTTCGSIRATPTG